MVTGGAGFIGSHVARRLLELGREVVIVDSLTNYYDPLIKKHNLSWVQASDRNNSLSIYVADICNLEKLREIFEKEQPDLICHLAGIAGVRDSIENPHPYMEINVIGTLNMLELARQFGVSHWVFASSSSVYGDDLPAPFNENQEVSRPCSTYAATKCAGELLAHTYYSAHNISCTCLRFFTVYGPRGRPDMAAFKFMNAIHKGDPIMQYGNGTSMRDFTFVDDIVDGIVCALERPFGFEVINLGRGEPIFLKDFIATIEDVVGSKADIIVRSVPIGDVAMTHADITKAQKLLDFNPRVGLCEGLKRMYEWYKNEYSLTFS